MKKTLLSNRSALTLVEMIAAVVLITFIFAGCIITIVTSMRLFKTELSSSIMVDDLTLTLEWIKKDALLSNNADITTPNEVTLDLELNFSSIQIRYYVKDSTELYRQIVGSASDGKLITDLIDTANPPEFTKPEGGNYLLSEVWIKDSIAKNPAHQSIGVMLRCCST